MHNYKFTFESLKHLRHADERLQKIAEMALSESEIEFQVEKGSDRVIHVYAIINGQKSYGDLLMFEIYHGFNYCANRMGVNILWGSHLGISNGHLELI